MNVYALLFINYKFNNKLNYKINIILIYADIHPIYSYTGTNPLTNESCFHLYYSPYNALKCCE